MKTNRIFSLFLLAAFVLPAVSAMADSVGFEVLPIGTMFGAPFGQVPGDYLFSEGGADLFISTFLSSGTPYFNYCSIEPSFGPPADFHDNNIMQVNNVGVIFDFSAPGNVTFEYLNWGGSVNIQVNGYGAVLEGPDLPSLAGTLAPGITMTVTSIPVSGGHKGTATITGSVQRLRLGGQEFFLDDVRCGGQEPGECDYEVNHQSLAAGMAWGSSYGQAPGDFMFMEDGIPVHCEYFHYAGGGGTFGNCLVASTPSPVFGFDKVMAFSNINNRYDIEALDIITSQVRFEYLDYGGIENLQVNDGPLFVDDLDNMSGNVAPGVTMSVITYPAGGGAVRGVVTLTGDVWKLMLGGQEFFADNICAYEEGTGPDPCDLIVDNESQSLGDAWGSPYGQVPGELIFIEDGIGVRVDNFLTGSGFSFNEARITSPECGLMEDNAMWLSNIVVAFDLSNVPPVNYARFDFCDCGGYENLIINGDGYIGELDEVPVNYFGSDIEVHVEILGYNGCKFGTVHIMGGGLQSIGVGGQEFQIDNFCVGLENLSSAPENMNICALNVERNFPNPFNPSTTIAFSTSRGAVVELSVIDLAGRRVVSLVDEYLEAGTHEVFWSGRDTAGRQAATGVYFVQLRSGQDVVSRKITMIK